ncbi:MAG TPA: class I SAM-dependent methyltransferase [Thermoanaerobaculia bacterium]|nr:class I SAM-dependent methyltransferase [Thermoanaerobaculia bacterium]
MTSRLKIRAFEALRSLAALTPARRLFEYRYAYMFRPRQLAFLVQCLDRTRDVPGAIVEVGCAFGATTVFLNEHLDDLGVPRQYVCIDTFRGFTAEDVRAERELRPGAAPALRAFKANRRRWFEQTLADNGVQRAVVHQGDAKEFPFASLAPVAFALIDVDLYQPVKVVLDRLWPAIAPGGLVVVDDCEEDGPFAGALMAAREFAGAHGIPLSIVVGKLGVLEKGARP